jgi:putative acetyltransferase
VIRPEQPSDAPRIHALHAASFPTPAEARLVDLLRAAGRLMVSLVAEVDHVIVGHVAFSPVTAASAIAGAGLGPIAVAAAHRRRGIGADLVRKGLDACRGANLGWIVVLGAPAYYSRFGFHPASELGLFDEYRGGAAFQAVELIHGALPVGAGLVRYANEFAALEA